MSQATRLVIVRNPLRLGDARRLAGGQVHKAIVACTMTTTSELTAVMRDAGHHSVRVNDQPRSSRIVSIGDDHPNPDIGQPGVRTAG